MNKSAKRRSPLITFVALLLIAACVYFLGGEGLPGKAEPTVRQGEAAATAAPESAAQRRITAALDENGAYQTRDEVALYLHLYGRLPHNYITKSEAEKLGWDASRGNLWQVAPGKSIGGSRFGNYEGLLPEKNGRTYYECDIDYGGGARNAKRIVYSNDGLIYYTQDHYESFVPLYNAEGAL